MYDILNGTKESERVIYNDKDPETGFVAVVDSKWKTHPNCEEIPKNEWKNVPGIQESCYILVLVRDCNLKSIRDLTSKHIPMLENIFKQTMNAIYECYG